MSQPAARSAREQEPPHSSQPPETSSDEWSYQTRKVPLHFRLSSHLQTNTCSAKPGDHLVRSRLRGADVRRKRGKERSRVCEPHHVVASFLRGPVGNLSRQFFGIVAIATGLCGRHGHQVHHQEHRNFYVQDPDIGDACSCICEFHIFDFNSSEDIRLLGFTRMLS